jgi:hypothetical protein
MYWPGVRLIRSNSGVSDEWSTVGVGVGKGNSTVTLDPAITIQAKDGLPMRLEQRS